MRRGDGGLLLGASLGAAIAGTRLCGEAYPAGAREALCPAQQERRSRRGGDLRGGRASGPALRSRALCGEPGGADAPSGARADGRATHGGAQRPRGHLSEIGVVAAQGVQNAYALKRLLAYDGVDDDGEIVVPDCVRVALLPLVRQIDALDEAIETIDRELEASAKADETARRLMPFPGSARSPPQRFSPRSRTSARFPAGEFAAFLGLTPREHSSGGKPRLGRITKMGDRYLRKLLVVGACSALAARKGHNDALRRWASGMLERKTAKYKFKLTAVALANKLARIVYALATKGGNYDDRPVAA